MCASLCRRAPRGEVADHGHKMFAGDRRTAATCPGGRIPRPSRRMASRRYMRAVAFRRSRIGLARNQPAIRGTASSGLTPSGVEGLPRSWSIPPRSPGAVSPSRQGIRRSAATRGSARSRGRPNLAPSVVGIGGLLRAAGRDRARPRRFIAYLAHGRPEFAAASWGALMADTILALLAGAETRFPGLRRPGELPA